MKAIKATPEEVRKVFSERYIIPSFQRPYSWEKEQCEKLWDDITEFCSIKLIKELQPLNIEARYPDYKANIANLLTV